MAEGDQERTIRNKALFLEKYADSKGIITSACAMTGIDRSTYYDWIDNDPEFKDKVLKLGREQIDYVHDKLLAGIVDDNITAIIFYLKNKHPDYRQKLELSGEVTQTKKYSAMSDEELIAALQEARQIKESLDNVDTESNTEGEDSPED